MYHTFKKGKKKMSVTKWSDI